MFPVASLTKELALATLAEAYCVNAYGEGYFENHGLPSEREVFNELSWRVNETYEYNGITIRCVKNVGGYEGSGEERWAVFSLEDETGIRYFRKDGYYASYDGTTWDGAFREVKPTERTVVFYE